MRITVHVAIAETVRLGIHARILCRETQLVAAVGRTAEAKSAPIAVIGFDLELSKQVVHGYGTAVTTTQELPACS